MPGSLERARMAIVTCMDPRIRLPAALGTSADHLFVLRNGGGRVTDDVVRSLVLCTKMLNVTQVGVLQHTDCRLHGLTNEELVLRTGVDIDFMSCSNPVAGILEDVRRLQSCAVFSPEVRVWGGLYCVQSHTIRTIAGTS